MPTYIVYHNSSTMYGTYATLGDAQTAATAKATTWRNANLPSGTISSNSGGAAVISSTTRSVTISGFSTTTTEQTVAATFTICALGPA